MALGSTQPVTEINARGKGGRCLGLTSLPPSCADCFEIWESQPPGFFRPVQVLLYLYNDPGGSPSVTNLVGPGSFPGQSLLDLWWTKWHCNTYLSTTSLFPCQYHSTTAPSLSLTNAASFHNTFETCRYMNKGFYN
jgi:hypothetical protein